MQALSEPDLLGLVDRILGPNGILHADGKYRFNPLQQRYAHGVAKGLLRQDPHGLGRAALNFMQAGTGTGKTVGYLVPLMLLAACTGRRVGVSTYTRSLQRQVLSECEHAAACVELVTGIRVSVAFRVGRQNFACHSGITRMREALVRAGRLDAESVAFFNELSAWLGAKTENGQPKNSGLIIDFLEETGAEGLPPAIDQAILGLQATDSEIDQQQYQASLARAADASLVVFNHAIMLANAMLWGKLMPKIDMVVVDEADTLPRIAESMLSDKISLNQAGRIVQAVESRLGDDRLSRLVNDIASKVSDLHALADHNGMLVITGSSCSALQISIKKAVTAWAPWLANEGAPDGFESGKNRELWLDFLLTGRSLQRGLDAMIKGDSVAVLSWSPVKEFPSLHIGHAEPGHQLRKLWTPIEDAETGSRMMAHTNLCFTSATLATPGKPLPLAMASFMQDVGVIRYPRSGEDVPVHYVTEDLMAVVEPFNFGKLHFVVADPRVPDPFIRADDTDEGSGGRLNEEWLAYAARTIEIASQAGGRTLVLAGSYRDLQALKALLPADKELFSRHIFHERGQRLGDLIPAFKERDDSILLTPAAWEGLNLPGLIKQAVILRVPFPPSETTDQLLKRLVFRQAGMATDRIDAILAARRQSAARQRLAQGIGRPIRKEDDAATIWFADPRFPAPDWVGQLATHPVVLDAAPRRHQGALVESIPQRFRSTSYQVAKVLTVDGAFLEKRR